MKKTPKTILRLPLEERARMAFKEAIEGAIDEHARLGLPLYIGRNGSVVAVSPDELRDARAIDEGDASGVARGDVFGRVRRKLRLPAKR